MIIVETIKELRLLIKKFKNNNKTIGLVPTMGALHEGHISLVKYSKQKADITILSIFVNPIQFGQNEDLSKYPRDLEKDALMCEKAGVDVIFHPSVLELLGEGNCTFVDIEKLQDNLCGLSRPGHFRGVCTIVSKFFNIIKPDYAFFGKKDIQQYYIIKKMTNDLNFDIEITGCPIVRESDGLAMSSRNVYLSAEERNNSLVLSKSIKIAVTSVINGEKNPEKIINDIINIIKEIQNAKIDYIKIVNENMQDVKTITNENILAIAVFIGKTRLIDNHIIGEKICF